jgi:F420-dependent methylenetetrahydromethanopterin dehydrogenase
MNQELIDMAREAGFFIKDNEAYSPSVQEDHELTPFLEAFAALVAAAEREKFCAVLRQLHDSYSLASRSNNIRAKGETK